MSEKLKVTGKDTARMVRLAFEAARMLQGLEREMNAFELEGELVLLRYQIAQASERIMADALRCPGVRVAVFSLDSTEEGK